MAQYKRLKNLPNTKDAYGKEFAKAFERPTVKSDAVPAQQHAGHHHRELSAIRTAEHRGHKIAIKTTYEITIDGKPFKGHVAVDDEGHLHCHALPYANYGSAVDFVKAVIDIYPDTYGPRAQSPQSGQSGQGGHDHG